MPYSHQNMSSLALFVRMCDFCNSGCPVDSFLVRSINHNQSSDFVVTLLTLNMPITTEVTCSWNYCKWAATWDFQQCGMCDQQRLNQPAHAQSDQSLCKSLEYSTTLKLLTEHHLEFLSLKRGCTGWPESTLVKMPQCWKSHVAAHIFGLDAYILAWVSSRWLLWVY